MKVIVIHGDHIVDSYERLQKLISVARERGWEIKRITEPSQNLTEEIVSSGLFEKERLIVLENVNFLRKTDIEWMKTKGEKAPANLIIFHQGILSQTLLKSIPVNKIEEFKLPKLIWIFLDTLSPGNERNSLQLLHKIVKNQPVEFVLALLARHLRNLYWVKETSNLPFPSWRVGKLKRQASKFTKDLLADLITSLSEADIKSKTSKEELIDSLDFIIATKLE